MAKHELRDALIEGDRTAKIAGQYLLQIDRKLDRDWSVEAELGAKSRNVGRSCQVAQHDGGWISRYDAHDDEDQRRHDQHYRKHRAEPPDHEREHKLDRRIDWQVIASRSYGISLALSPGQRMSTCSVFIGHRLAMGDGSCLVSHG